MKKFVKAAAIILTVAMLAGLAVTSASAASTQRVLFVNAGAMSEVVAATDTTPEYKPYTINIDGKLETIKVLKVQPNWQGNPDNNLTRAEMSKIVLLLTTLK